MLGNRLDLKRVPLGTDVFFREDEQHLHATIQGKEYIVQKRDDESFFIIGREGVMGILVKRTPPNTGYRVVIFQRQRMVI